MDDLITNFILKKKVMLVKTSMARLLVFYCRKFVVFFDDARLFFLLYSMLNPTGMKFGM